MCSIFGVLELKSDPTELRSQAIEMSKRLRKAFAFAFVLLLRLHLRLHLCLHLRFALIHEI